jgi:hypothetical protein
VPVTTGAVMPKKEESDVPAGRRLPSVVPGAQRMGGRRSLLIIALDVFAIWALASFSREAAI